GFPDPPPPTAMTTLPPLAALSDVSQTTRALDTLFEPSAILQKTLAPALATRSQPWASYEDLIDASLAELSSWDDALRAQFIAGHPRIGETQNLSHLSAKEQAARATPPEVLARLAHLNMCYERRYPSLRYITFVNGRSRAEVAHEMEDALGIPHSLDPHSPPLEEIIPITAGDPIWRSELDRAVSDIGHIATSRLTSLRVMEER
ncbi:unnamed protein product, partial [Mycena citricolor]